MNPTSEGEEENTFRKQLQNIDKWLSNVTPVQGDSILKNSSNPPNQPITPNSNFNTMDKRLFKKPRFPFKRRFQPSSNQNHITTSSPSSAGNLRIIPIGGFEEVGKNMTVFEYNNDIVVVDMGFQFPEEDMLGIDYVLPDPTYLKEHKNKIRGIFLTHGHLDHIGGIPYLLPQLGFPQVYGTSLTMGFVKKQLEEFKLLNQARLHIFDPKDQFRVGAFNISFFRVNHSIPDSVGIVIECPAGRIVHTGDFKFDFTPLGQLPADFQTIAAIGKKGVDILISDSTNSTEPGHTTSEKVIADNLSEIIRTAPGRLIITSFSSLIGRLQQIMDSAIEHNRKIFLSGRSMETNIRIAQHLGYIKVPRGLFINNKELKKFPEDRLIILTTGSQGEDVSALARMSMDTHSFVRIQKGDTVVLSSSPIIGNEGAIIKVINRLCKRGAKVMTNNDIDIHTSGHGKQEDLKLMIKLINPHYLIPAHGNCYMRVAHKELGEICGIPENKIFLLDNGEVVQGNFKNGYQKTNEKIPAEYIMVEGPERSPVEGAILMDRQLMAKNGVVMVLFKITKSPLGLISPPIILHRGFVYMDFSKIILDKIIQVSANAFHEFTQRNQNQQNFSEKELENYLQSSIDRELVRLLDKRPLVVPVLISG